MRKGAISAVVTILVVVGIYLAPAKGPQAGSSDTFRQLKLFGDVFERVRSEYVEEVTDEKLIETAINGMLTSLDPHSGYLDAKRYRDMQVQTKGEFGGLGIEVTMENGLVKVVSPIDDTPAYRRRIVLVFKPATSLPISTANRFLASAYRKPLKRCAAP